MALVHPSRGLVWQHIDKCIREAVALFAFSANTTKHFVQNMEADVTSEVGIYIVESIYSDM